MRNLRNEPHFLFRCFYSITARRFCQPCLWCQTSQNVAYESLVIIADTTTISSVAANEDKTIQSLTIPETGKWKVEATINGYSGQFGQTYEVSQSLKKNGNNFMEYNKNYSSSDSTWLWMGATIIGVVDANKGDKIDSAIHATNHSISQIQKIGCCMIATRIG